MVNGSLGLKPINIRLCGSIPRHELNIVESDEGARWSLGRRLSSVRGPSCFATTNGPTPTTSERLEPQFGNDGETAMMVPSMKLSIDNGTIVTDDTAVGPVVLDPPKWAVPAKGETRLEPVCEATGRQTSVDLTRQACIRIGRSPNADVQLFHATSSRRHAMIFHHENGSCYIVDCGSAHGTFLNGRRVSSPSIDGISIPHKVRRGAMVRFGGPGAPCFILKSFSFELKELDQTPASPDMLDAVRRNTRLNALGQAASSIVHSNLAATIEAALTVTRKRSFDSLDSRETIDEIPAEKRLRCSSPELSPLAPLRLVSPDLPMLASKRRVTFSPLSPQVFYPTIDDAASTEPAVAACE
ncbi:hypothetical protein MPSEU_000173100 [Mayamaea pseudoterrestris]|nr:hypothetical protein MPSEU_000173100 [Mayamaea pseudoterrestris]